MNTANSISNASKGAVSVDVTFPSGGPAETGTVIATLTDTNGSTVTGSGSVSSGSTSSTSFTVTPINASGLADGAVTVSAYFVGGATSTTFSGTAATKDITAPTAASSLALTATGGTSQVSNTLNAANTNFTVSATINAGEATGGSAQLLLNGSPFSSAITDTSIASGDTTVALTSNFANAAALQSAIGSGSQALTVKLTDSAGNSATSSPLPVVADYTAPAAATGLALTASGGTAQVANKLNSGNTNFTVSATISGDVGSAGGTAELLVGETSFSPEVTASVASGTVSVDLHPFIGQSWVWERTGQTVGRLRRRRG